MQWFCKSFNELSILDFHNFLQLRNEVFVVEQACIFQDLDGKDELAFHIYAKDGSETVLAYARIFKPLDYYKEAAIGRIVVHKDHRNKNLGTHLLNQSIAAIENNFGEVPIKIGAQTYLKQFYESFGFFQIGEAYIEDGIPHIHMLNQELLDNE